MSLRQDAPRYELTKVYPKVIHISRFDFVTKHIQVATNVFVDMSARWSREHRTEKAICGSIWALYQSIVLGELEINDVNVTEIINAEQKAYFTRVSAMS